MLEQPKINFRGLVKVSRIKPPDHPVREDYGPEDELNKLSASIERLGQLEPIGVRQIPGGTDLEVIFGNRRFEVISERLKWEHVDAIVYDSEIAGSTKIEMAQQENDARLAMSDLERAKAEAYRKRALEIEGSVKTKKGPAKKGEPTQNYAEKRAGETGESARHIDTLVTVGNASSTVQDAVGEGVVTLAAGAALANQPPYIQQEVVDALREQGARSVKPGSIKDLIDRREVENHLSTQPDVLVTTYYDVERMVEDVEQGSVDVVFVTWTGEAQSDSRLEAFSNALLWLVPMLKETGHLFVIHTPEIVAEVFAQPVFAEEMKYFWQFVTLLPQGASEPNDVSIYQGYRIVSWFRPDFNAPDHKRSDIIRPNSASTMNNEVTILSRAYTTKGSRIVEAIFDGMGNGAELMAMGHQPILLKLDQEGEDVRLMAPGTWANMMGVDHTETVEAIEETVAELEARQSAQEPTETPKAAPKSRKGKKAAEEPAQAETEAQLADAEPVAEVTLSEYTPTQGYMPDLEQMGLLITTLDGIGEWLAEYHTDASMRGVPASFHVDMLLAEADQRIETDRYHGNRVVLAVEIGLADIAKIDIAAMDRFTDPQAGIFSGKVGAPAAADWQSAAAFFAEPNYDDNGDPIQLNDTFLDDPVVFNDPESDGYFADPAPESGLH